MPGVKQLTCANWREPDPANAVFGEINLVTGEQRRISADAWARRFLAVELDDRVPEDMRTMWAVARGTLLYGAFFYPLYALGDEQLHRVADAAVLARIQTPFQALQTLRVLQGEINALFATTPD